MVSPLNGSLQLNLSCLSDTVRLQLRGDTDSLVQPDHHKARRTAALMQDIRQFSPQLVWQEDLEGRVLWSNAAYQTLAGQDGSTPFDALNADMDGKLQKRQRVARTGDGKQWFEVTTLARDNHLIHFATEILPVITISL